MSSIFDFIGSIFNSPGTLPTRIVVKSSNWVSTAAAPPDKSTLFGTAAVAEEQYVRIWVTRMLLKDSTQWFTTLYPAVYSIVHLSYGNSDVDLTNIVGPKQLGDLKAADTNHSLDINQAMTGLLPFRGGSIRVSCGLVQMPISNLLSNFLNTVGDFATKLVQPQISTAIALAQSIATGVESLLGAGQAKILIYYDNTFTGVPGEQTLQSGFVFLSDVPSGTITADQLWIIDDEPRIGATAATAKPITGQNYAVLQMELLSTRDDWEQFTAIEQPLQSAITAKIEGKAADAANFIIQARTAAATSTDLTNADRVRVIKAMDAQYDAAGAGVAQPPVALADVMAKQ